jgi:hypothetical protein
MLGLFFLLLSSKSPRKQNLIYIIPLISWCEVYFKWKFLYVAKPFKTRLYNIVPTSLQIHISHTSCRQIEHKQMTGEEGYIEHCDINFDRYHRYTTRSPTRVII